MDIFWKWTSEGDIVGLAVRLLALADVRGGSLHRMARETLSRQEQLFELAFRSLIGQKGRTESIEHVAKDLGLTRSTAHAMLSDARRLGLIRTVALIHEPPTTSLEPLVLEELAEWGINKVWVITTAPDDRQLDSAEYRSALRASLGAAAAEFIEQEVQPRPGDHVVLGGGRVCANLASYIEPRHLDLVLRPLAVGGAWRPMSHMGANAVLQLMAWKLVLARSEFLTGELKVVCPDVSVTAAEEVNRLFDLLDKKLDHESVGSSKAAGPGPLMESYPELRGVLGPESPRPKLLVSAVGRRRYAPTEKGTAGPHPDTSSYLRMVAESAYYLRERKRLGPDDIFDHLPAEEYETANRALSAAGVVADVARHGINAKGERVPGFLEKTSVSVTLPTMRRWREGGTVAVAACGGSRMLHAFRAAVKTRVYSAAIVDSALAIQLIPARKRPAMYRNIPVLKLPGPVERADAEKAYESPDDSIGTAGA